eukprot:TRINITY_DN2654_c0_g1_i4.p1 TRINITY_DN2654_c0_g1~~TRINITY_DN2654_c0_g1_i4.p1  ORF type:complete len:367 (+),score=55.66 TRINITY_DN2654_c0_g1_i4:155-1255(+)
MSARIPYAKSKSGDCLAACTVSKDQGAFLCYGCSGELLLRKGPKRVAHFAHKSNADCSSGRESWQHLLAKHFVVDHLSKWSFELTCPLCHDSQVHHQFKDVSAHLEFGYTGFFIDVMLCRSGTPFLAVEILHTHKVDDKKRSQLADKQLPMVEIEAEQIIEKVRSKTFAVHRHEKCLKCIQSQIPADPVNDDTTLSTLAHPRSTSPKKADVKKIEDYSAETCPISLWQKNVEQAIDDEDFKRMDELLKQAPTGADTAALNIANWERAAELAMTRGSTATMKSMLETAPEGAKRQPLQDVFKKKKEWEDKVRTACRDRNLQYMKSLKSNAPQYVDFQQYERQLEEVIIACNEWTHEIERACHEKKST